MTPSRLLQIVCGLIFAYLVQPHAFAATWNSTSAGNWSDTSAAGWNGAYPNAIGDSAIFSQNWGGTRTFTMDVTATVGSLNLTNTVGNVALNLNGANPLTFDAAGSGPATLTWAGSLNIDGIHSTISAPIILNDDLVASGSTALTISGAIIGTGKSLTVNASSSTAPAQFQLSGNNSGLTGGINLNANVMVKFGSLNSLGGGGANVRLASGSAGILTYNPGNAVAMNSAIAKLDATSAGMFGFGSLSGPNNVTYAIDLSPVTNLRFGTFYANTYNFNAGSSLVFDFANNGNTYKIGGTTIGSSGALNVNVANFFTGNRNLEVLPQNLVITESQNFIGKTTLSPNPNGIITGNQYGAITLNGNGALTGTSAVLLGRLSPLTFDNTGTNFSNRLNDSASITFSGGRLIYSGSATANSAETLGQLHVSKLGQATNRSILTVSYGGSQTAIVTAASLTRSAGNGTLLVNGVGLGKDSTSTNSVARLLLDTAPTLVGTTDALSTGINAAAKDTKIVPFLVGAATATTGGLGTAGTANTFLTYHATGGLRPLNPTDEFTNNSIVSGHNTRITSATTAASSVSLNSVVIEGANLTISAGQTLTNTSGAVLFVTANQIAGGTLAFGTTEAIISTGGAATLASAITGSGGLTKSGADTLTLSSSANTYTGDTNVTAGTLLLSGTGTIGGSTKVNVREGSLFNVAAKTAGFAVTNLEGAGTVMGLSGQAVTVSGNLAAGDDGIGTLTFSAGNLTLANGATLDYQIGGTNSLTLNDAINLTQAGSTVGLSGINTLNLFHVGTVDPTGKSFVIFDSVAAIASAGAWNINYGTTGWTGGTVSLNPLDNTQVIISGLTVVPEPASLALLVVAGGLAFVRRRMIYPRTR